ncbi:glycoside hydrolase family 43 protein [Microbacterium sp. SD291]|uniref:glycoside hydrolase family 43 protein n=1 Tax=Microbacterium sp. SD291 TaxID=2782007 RepID=UPI001EC1E99D|nr:glycoside hydrolase family 43 protein [Microbacterium sp. SD291]MBO0979646.1 glycoside hydrolase family 43 protein [Microbacterium sp. SD291]
MTTFEAPADPRDPYGYLMVHFIEDATGYAEKIFLDISRGDDPEKWDPLNGGMPILASQRGTTGVRDPFLTRNPETGRYYIVATDLRVFGGDGGSGDCTEWCHWTRNGSTDLVVWESDDLVNWGEPRTFDTALNGDGVKVADLGMAWAPEALWVDDYYPDGRGALVMYWSSNVYRDAEHTGECYSRVLWGATTDFSQATYSYGGEFVDTGADAIDTTMIRHEGTTYRVTKDNGLGKGIYMESTDAARWWEPGTVWTTLQTRIGAEWSGGDPGGVEGPAVFRSHSEDRWYLYVDVIPSIGYRPMVTTDLDSGWSPLTDPSFSMAPHTKHGGIVSLTRAEYDRVRAADAVSLVTADLGAVEIEAGSSAGDLAAALPQQAEVSLAYGRGTASLPVTWDTASADLPMPGTYPVTGTVQTLGANLNSWTGAGGSTAWNAPDRVLSRSTALTVTAQVTVSPRASASSASTIFPTPGTAFRR